MAYFEVAPKDASARPTTACSPLGEAVTPSDTANFTYTARGLYVGVGGTVPVVFPDGTVVNFVGVPSGFILPVECIRVNSTNLVDASDMVALF